MRQRVAGIVGSLMVAILLFACEGGLDEAPPEIRGRWVTSDATYSDVWFQIGPRTLTLYLGAEAGESTHPLDRVVEQVDGALRHYELHHVNREGVEDALRIVYQVDNEPLIRFENRRNVHWRRLQP